MAVGLLPLAKTKTKKKTQLRKKGLMVCVCVSCGYSFPLCGKFSKSNEVCDDKLCVDFLTKIYIYVGTNHFCRNKLLR